MGLPLSPALRRYGAFRSKPDHRDFGLAQFIANHPATAKIIPPPRIDLSSSNGPVRDQGQLGACTAFAGTAMTEFLYNRYKSQSLELSPEFLYYQERLLDGDLGQGDTGSTGRTSVQAMNQFGVCLEASDPYSDIISETPPTPTQLQQALLYRSGPYHNVGNNVWDAKFYLASGYGFIVGFNVYDSFESDAMATSGLMSVPNTTTEQLLGGHEVFACGYDDTIQCPGATLGAFKIQNSWGTSWGLSGFFWMPYQCFADNNIVMDAFLQHFGNAWTDGTN